MAVPGRIKDLLGLIRDRKSTRLNSSHANISYAVFCLKKNIRETGGPARANSVAVYEAMYKEYRLFDLDVPFAIQGDMVLPASSNMFNGNSFNIDGNPN